MYHHTVTVVVCLVFISMVCVTANASSQERGSFESLVGLIRDLDFRVLKSFEDIGGVEEQRELIESLTSDLGDVLESMQSIKHLELESRVFEKHVNRLVSETTQLQHKMENLLGVPSDYKSLLRGRDAAELLPKLMHVNPPPLATPTPAAGPGSNGFGCIGFPDLPAQDHSSFVEEHGQTRNKVVVSIAAYEKPWYLREMLEQWILHSEPSTLFVVHLNRRSMYPSDLQGRADWAWLWRHPRVFINCDRLFVSAFSGKVFLAHVSNLLWMKHVVFPQLAEPPTHIVIAASNSWVVRSGYESHVLANHASSLDMNCKKKYHWPSIIQPTTHEYRFFQYTLERNTPMENFMLNGSLRDDGAPSLAQVVVQGKHEGAYFPIKPMMDLAVAVNAHGELKFSLDRSDVFWEEFAFHTWMNNYYVCYADQKVCPRDTLVHVDYSLSKYIATNMNKNRVRVSPEDDTPQCTFPLTGFFLGKTDVLRRIRGGMYPNLFMAKFEGPMKVLRSRDDPKYDTMHRVFYAPLGSEE